MIELERELRGLAAELDLPETPDIASNVRRYLREQRRAAWPWRIAPAVAIAVLVVGAGFAVPQARTAILRLFGIGAQRYDRHYGAVSLVQCAGGAESDQPTDRSLHRHFQ